LSSAESGVGIMADISVWAKSSSELGSIMDAKVAAGAFRRGMVDVGGL
jgi:hypothetical protein